MLSFQKLRVYQRSIEFLALTIEVIGNLPKGHSDLADQPISCFGRRSRNRATSPRVQAGAQRWITARFYAHARGSAMEAAASLDTMRVMKLIAETSR